ncbi:MAG: SAM-dependent methyltransferase [Oscillospiraceae bacterium]|nr:SAM-dependent methyltransferase [Oscillospiraceae bacterium]
MNDIKIFPIGKIENENGETKIRLNPAYSLGLKGLGEYSHVQVIWWMDGCDNDKDRKTLIEKKPYVKGPEEIGVFALRSPERPNPIAVSNANILYVDEKAGTIGISYIDAFSGSIVLDLKPYTPSLDRVEHSSCPDWCNHWPKCCEESGGFDWESEFNF